MGVGSEDGVNVSQMGRKVGYQGPGKWGTKEGKWGYQMVSSKMAVAWPLLSVTLGISQSSLCDAGKTS